MDTQVMNECRSFLIVEDDPLVRWNMVDLVKACGFEVQEAANTAEALSILDQAAEGFAGVLTDIQMPGTRSGIVLANHVRTLWPHLMVVVVSGARRPLQGELPEKVEFIPKPLSLQEFRSAIAGELPAA
jgi:CheY-like chemotaxis protein